MESVDKGTKFVNVMYKKCTRIKATLEWKQTTLLLYLLYISITLIIYDIKSTLSLFLKFILDHINSYYFYFLQTFTQPIKIYIRMWIF